MTFHCFETKVTIPHVNAGKVSLSKINAQVTRAFMQLQRLSTYLLIFNKKVTLNSISPKVCATQPHIALCDHLIRIFLRMF